MSPRAEGPAPGSVPSSTVLPAKDRLGRTELHATGTRILTLRCRRRLKDKELRGKAPHRTHPSHPGPTLTRAGEHPRTRAAKAPQRREVCEESTSHRPPREERAPRKPLPAVPSPAYPAPALLQAATGLLADLHRHDPRLLLSACDTAHLAPGVAAWAGARRRPRRRTPRPDRRPAARGCTPPRRLPGAPPRRPASALTPVPGTGRRPAARTAPDAELRRLRPGLSLTRPWNPLPRLPIRSSGGRLA